MHRSLSNMSACRKSLFAPRGAGIHRRPSRFPCALPPKTGGATGRKNLFFPLPLFSELVKVLKIFDFNGAGHPSWVSRTHPFFPLRKSPLAALHLFPLLGLSPRQEPPCGGCAPKRACGRSPAHTLHPQGVCSIRKAAQPLTAALPYRHGEFTPLLTALNIIIATFCRESKFPTRPFRIGWGTRRRALFNKEGITKLWKNPK